MTECRWCGVAHPNSICPRVKALEFAADGITVKRVEFMTPKDYQPITGFPQMPQPAIGIPLPQTWRYPTSICGQTADTQTRLQNLARSPIQ